MDDGESERKNPAYTICPTHFFSPFFPFFVRLGLMKDDQTDSLAGSRPTNFASDIEVLSDLDFFLFRVEGAEG